MKKLIVLSVVFALVATAAFAVDIGANVFGLVIPAQGGSGQEWDNDAGAMVDLPSEVYSDLSFQRVRFSGYGEAGDGAFGGQMRIEGTSVIGLKDAFAFWKPIDQLKVLIGANSDGFYGKEGVTGWGFNGNPYDGGVAFGGGNIWGWGPYNKGDIKYRDAFYGGYGANALQLNITPVDMFTLNIAIPFEGGVETADVFKSVMVQADVNLDFGNIALTFQAADDAGQVWVYYGGSFGDLSLDVGFSYNMDENAQPVGIGAGLKYATDAFGVKFRVVANLGGDKMGTNVMAEVLPYFSLGDNIAAFVSIGICTKIPDSGDSVFDWHFNPYIRIGEEWGAQFLVGVQVYTSGGGGSDGYTKWAIPIAIMLMF